MRTRGSAEELERRRRHAVDLFLDGEPPEDICRILDVSKSARYGWVKAVREHGPEALTAKTRTGARRLDDEQLAQLALALRQGSVAHGWINDLWTGKRVATLIQRLFGIVYTPEGTRDLGRGHPLDDGVVDGEGDGGFGEVHAVPVEGVVDMAGDELDLFGVRDAGEVLGSVEGEVCFVGASSGAL